MSSLTVQDDSSLRPFQYQALNRPREVRFLRVSKGNEATSKIRVKFLNNVLTGQPPRYEAISYCWGDPTPTERIWVTPSEYLDISASAASVLQYLITSKKTGYIWIDALCINQNDLTERAQQVCLMSDVFARATSVIAWIGPSSIDSDLAMTFVHELAAKVKQLERKERKLQGLTTAEITSTLPLWSDPVWRAFNHLIDRAWFNRLWVVQEMVLSRRAVLTCGDKVVPLTELLLILEFLGRHNLREYYIMIYRWGELIRPPCGECHLQYIAQCTRNHRHGHHPCITDLVVAMRTFEASDPRDKVYALLGLATGVQHLIFQPDYHSSPHQLYTNVSLHLLLHHQSVKPLHTSGLGSPHTLPPPALPSWVTDYSATEYYNVFSHFEETTWCAGGLPTKARILPHPTLTDAIVLPATRLIDTVTHVFPRTPHTRILQTYAETRINAADVLTWLSTWKKAIANLPPYPNGETKDQVEWRALICNLAGTTGLATREYERYYNHWQRAIRILATCSSEIEGDAELTRSGLTDGHAAFQGASALTVTRRLFVTQGGLVGKGPPYEMKRGDVVAIVRGGKSPFILRENAVASTEAGASGKQKKYSLVGDCYVHGLMNGEGLTGKGLTMGSEGDVVLI